MKYSITAWQSFFRVTLVVVCIGFVLSQSGCMEPDSIGRFRATPATNIILDGLGGVDEDPGVFESAREPEPKDLRVKAEDYVIGSGDTLVITIFELFASDMEWRDQREVSDIGRLTLPVLGTFLASGRTELELTEDIEGMLAPEILKDPKVSIVVMNSREKVFSISGAVSAPGRYPLLDSDYRVSEALAQAGGAPQVNSDYVYVIRRVSPEDYGQEQDELFDGEEDDGWLIDDVVDNGGDDAIVDDGAESAEEPARPIEDSKEAESPAKEQEELLESIAPMSLMSVLDVGGDRAGSSGDRIARLNGGVEDLAAGQQEEVAEEQLKEGVDDADDASEPLKLVRGEDGGFELVPANGQSESAELAKPRELAAEGVEGEDDDLDFGFEDEQASLVQDVIRIDLKKLRGGEQSQNIVIRAGDDIQVPFNAVGVFYVMGQVSRPGPYSLNGDRLTLMQAIAVAGPMTPLAVPNRCDITRRISENKTVTYRWNLAKLFAGTAPDLFIKPNDIVNVGSHPVARWIAVARQSFRATYGYGFVYDRNFADKDFGN